MRETWRHVEGGMFDFEDFYQSITETLPDGARLIEVGVANGKSAIFLAEAMANQGKAFELHLIDSLDYGQEYQLQTIMKNVQASGLSDSINIMPYDSLNASLRYPDGWAHFIFIDSGHTYELTKAEIRLWHRKVMDDRYLAGHDYHSHNEVKKAVNEVVPAGIIESHETTFNNGVWAFKKGPNTNIL